MIVLDASAAVVLFLNHPPEVATKLQQRIDQPGESLHVPHLLDLEVAQVLRRSLFRGEIGADRAAVVVRYLTELPATRYPHWLLLGRIWELRANLTAYDAAYVALGEALGANLLTCDRALAAAPGHRARVEVF